MTKINLFRSLLPVVITMISVACSSSADFKSGRNGEIFLYTLKEDGTAASYDEAMLAASLQGLLY
jgi:hypothetical protein